ncbi:MAG: exo-alpha-sialidase [Bacteroidales bacterium]|nr:exo-alpha-sialidase [Bacteroidales bacterium]
MRLFSRFLLFNIILVVLISCYSCQSKINGNIDQVQVIAEERFTGRGNPHDVLLKTKIVYSGETVDLKSITIQLHDSDFQQNLKEIQVYYTGNDSIFDERTAINATLLGNKNSNKNILKIKLKGSLTEGENYLWITGSVSEQAQEGDSIIVSLSNIKTKQETCFCDSITAKSHREILLARKLIYAPNDYGSKNYRIPAIITAQDGSLVIATDQRKFNQTDLPEDIDILINRSTDGGKTWSQPQTIAKGSGKGKGFGDAVLACTNEQNGLICAFVGGDGLWESEVQTGKKIRSYFCKSLDNGQTWSQPIEITDFIFGEGCTNPVRKKWKASFFGSGQGLLTSKGRIILVAAIRTDESYSLQNHAVYSDDNGATWHVSEKASEGGDEAKVVELTDGSILMSIRHKGARWFNISTDGGETWQPHVSEWNDLQAVACNGDLIRYSSENKGDSKNRLLHSIPFDTEYRKNVSLLISYDEGLTWSLGKSICPFGSAYSSITVLPDATIGAYLEENFDSENYSMYFMNFSLNWLSNGKDSCK